MEPVRILPLPSSGRRPGLDALRAGATILVVMLHAAVPYTVAPMPGLTWPVRHTATSPLVDALFWGIEGAIMPLFFLLSGYGAAQSLAGKSGQFLSTRWRRLGWPLLGAAAVLLPLEFYVWLIGWALDARIEWKKLSSLKLGPYHENLWGLSHLWYLEYLLIYSALLWAGQRRLGRERPSAVTTLLRSVANLRVLILMAACVLWFAPEVVVGFQHSFVPVPAKFLFSGLFFAAGVAQFHQPSRFPLRASTAGVCCGALLFGLLPLIHRQTANPLVGVEKLLLVIGMAVYAVLVTQSVWQWAWSSTTPNSAATDSLARASFWIYLVHHPLVAVWQIGLRSTAWPADVQFAVCTAGTLLVSLAGYRWLVEGTRLSDFLEGRRRTALPAVAPVAPVPARRAA